MNSRVTAARADAEHKSNVVLQSQLDKMKADFDEQIKVRDAEAAQQLVTIEKKFAEVKADNAKMAALFSTVAKLPVPITVSTPPPTAQNPNPQPVATVPAPDFSVAMDYAKECEVCKERMKQIEADIADRQKQLGIANQQIAELKKENATIRKEAKGTFFANLKRDVKTVILGAAVGALAVCSSGHCK